MKNNPFIYPVLLSAALAVFSSFPCLSAPFNRIHTIINTPAARYFQTGRTSAGLSGAMYTLPSGESAWEEDLFFNYTFTDSLTVGLTRVNTGTLLGNVHFLLARNFQIPDLNLACGIENITDQRYFSTIDTYQEEYPVNMSGFLVASWIKSRIEVHLGIGNGRFINHETSGGQDAMLGFFYSAAYHFRFGELMYEHDGRDLNIGVKIPLGDIFTLNMAFTQLPQREGNNPAYGDVPYSHIAVGIIYTENILSEKIISKKSSGITDEERLAEIESVYAYYQSSLQSYAQGKYYDAIEALTKAIQLQPQLPLLYLRMGSIYWKLDLKDIALYNWQKVYDLNPENEELLSFIRENDELQISREGTLQLETF